MDTLVSTEPDSRAGAARKLGELDDATAVAAGQRSTSRGGGRAEDGEPEGWAGMGSSLSTELPGGRRRIMRRR
eukprot:702747-Hanusia_phi.AAC.3